MISKKLIAGTLLLVFSIFSIMVLAADMPTDDQIAKILMTTNNGEVSLGQLAKEKAQNKDVKKFAEHMVKAHSKNNKKSVKLATKIGLSPSENEKSSMMQQENDAAMASLKDLSGAEFDKAYIENQITTHQKVLTEFDNTLIPSAKNKKFKKMLEKTRKTVATHLEDAEKIKTTLK